MGNLLSTGGASQTLHVSIASLIVVVVWAASVKIWRKNVKLPKTTSRRAEWLQPNLVHRNHYGRRRLQNLDPNSEQQSTLRDFDLMPPKDSLSYANEMRDYLGTRGMPEHPYIVPESILDTEAYRALVTPWYGNGNVLDFINEREVSDERKVDLMIQIAEGLEYLHRLGTIHGNLYPANVLVTDDEDIVVTDAGIYTEVVRLMLSPSGRIRLSQSTFYKSRQELEGDDEPTQSADVYSFASTCYAVLTGQAPFSGVASPYQRVLKIIHPDGHRALPKPSSTSPMLWDLLMRCWSPEPTQRPTMDDVVYCLGRVKYFANRRSLLTRS